MRLFPDQLRAVLVPAVFAVACTPAGGGMAQCVNDAQCAAICDSKVAESLAPRTRQTDAGASYCEVISQAEDTCQCVDQFGTYVHLLPTECAVRGRLGACLYQPTATTCSAQSCRGQCEAVQAAMDEDNQRTITVQGVAGTCVNTYCQCTARTSAGCVAIPPGQSQASLTDCPDGG